MPDARSAPLAGRSLRSRSSVTRLLLLLAGALAVHLRKGDGPQKYAPALVCGLLVAVYLALHLGSAR
ncbi:hypothetical protein [Micromonospora sp. NPDC049497]|uniref:hypothetical protein n=1 Tax=Micromonospora sp. NPDC049497 TaxID=3364273 RepID=UPI0037B7D28B